MELTGFRIWQIEYEGGEYPKFENHLELAQQFQIMGVQSPIAPDPET
jgi:hypothetical protein